jgi:hypothetical protein
MINKMRQPICWCAVCQSYVKYADMDNHQDTCVPEEEEYDDEEE